jgi:hypothetical protein
MKKPFLISLVVCIILTACGGQKEIPTVFPFITPKPSVIATSTATATVTKTQPTKLPPTPTITPLPPYQTKQIIFDYNVIGDHSVYDWFFDPDFFRSYSRLVLYTDGQMIIPSKGEFGGTYKQKILSPNEIKQFLSKLKALGFIHLNLIKSMTQQISSIITEIIIKKVLTDVSIAF